MSTGFDGPARRRLAALADLLIPAGEDMPSASAAGVTGRWLDEFLKARPELLRPLLAIVDGGLGLEELRAADPAAFDLLADAVAGAYFLVPDVRRRLGYPGQQALPIVAEVPPDYEQGGLIASVKARGPVFRPTPGPVRSGA